MLFAYLLFTQFFNSEATDSEHPDMVNHAQVFRCNEVRQTVVRLCRCGILLCLSSVITSITLDAN